MMEIVIVFKKKRCNKFVAEIAIAIFKYLNHVEIKAFEAIRVDKIATQQQHKIMPFHGFFVVNFKSHAVNCDCWEIGVEQLHSHLSFFSFSIAIYSKHWLSIFSFDETIFEPKTKKKRREKFVQDIFLYEPKRCTGI